MATLTTPPLQFC